MIEPIHTNFRTLDLNLLRVFDEVMAEKSLTKAARNLSITQPAVSNALRRLRETLGDDLVRREGHGIAPTPFALMLWPNVRQALDQLQSALVPQQFIPTEARNAFVLAMADATAAELMGGLGQALEHHAPKVSIRVLPLTTRDPRNMLNEGTADLALGYFPAVLADLTAKAQSGEAVAFEHHRLYDGEYVCVMRRGHPLAQKNITLDEFCNARHLLVSFSGRPYGFIDEALTSIGRHRRVVMTVNQFFTAGRVVVNSDLLTVLPKHFVPTTGIADELFMCELPFKVPTLHVDALWHRRKHAQSDHIWLREHLIRIAHDVFKGARL
ncbi:LysR family transcriptional regulator [Limnohabitans sp. Rim11]|uniref:LysR family transcriptional regulator n=1 Tax=Limnohabitans sp. Rim11 TaxID=1100719 RepID=UPI000AF418A0|nr:LysR family transcriptional regulator [Limnohabitans sp. Rim11]